MKILVLTGYREIILENCCWNEIYRQEISMLNTYLGNTNSIPGLCQHYVNIHETSTWYSLQAAEVYIIIYTKLNAKILSVNGVVSSLKWFFFTGNICIVNKRYL